jgi:hypothetical protein
MAITTPRIRLKWERNLPEIAPPWTHWRLLGDGEMLADVSGDDLIGALRIIEVSVDKFRRICVTRARYDDAGHFVAVDKALFAITPK